MEQNKLIFREKERNKCMIPAYCRLSQFSIVELSRLVLSHESVTSPSLLRQPSLMPCGLFNSLVPVIETLLTSCSEPCSECFHYAHAHDFDCCTSLDAIEKGSTCETSFLSHDVTPSAFEVRQIYSYALNRKRKTSKNV